MSTLNENIDTSAVFNRKIIVEIRYAANANFLDKKGRILSQLTGLIPKAQWGIGDTAFKISDTENEVETRENIAVEVNRLAYVSSKIETIGKYGDNLKKIFDTVTAELSPLKIGRIGCRIQGTYKTKSKNFSGVLESFKKAFPSDSFISGFSVNDLSMMIRHESGMYRLGPVNSNDPFVLQEFPYKGRNNSIGIGLDTDNFILANDNSNLTDFKNVQNVLEASLAVEKALLERFGAF